jgi:hypothetical protein
VVVNVLRNPHASQAHNVRLRNYVHRFRNVNGGQLELLGEAEVAVGLQLLLAEDVVGVLLGAEHHGAAGVGGAGAAGAAQARLVEAQAGQCHCVIAASLKDRESSSSYWGCAMHGPNN